ncbi:MAG: hypothetical protein ACE5Q3_20325 [Alphaproteobacteria bacterium]
MDEHPAFVARMLATSCIVMKRHLADLQRHLALGDHEDAAAAMNALGAEVIRYEQRLRDLSSGIERLSQDRIRGGQEA